MLNNKTIAVVVPAFNEETQIGIVIETMPDFVDRIVVVDDCSTDNTVQVVEKYIAECTNNTLKISRMPTEIVPSFFNRAEVIAAQIRKEEEALYHEHEIKNKNELDRIILICNKQNQKAGGSLKVGYKWCREHGIDCTAVMAGDAQMDPAELYSICEPVVFENIDYVKGNRLSHKAAKRMIPKRRYFGNSVLSALTKIASGYWNVSDTQTGYTAVSWHALDAINIHGIYADYGVPNDILIKLNIARCTLREIPIKPVYAVGEQSKMKIGKVIPRVSFLLFKGFIKRIVQKYFLTDFHPIFLFYGLGFLTFLATLYFSVYIIIGLVGHFPITVGTYLGFLTFFMTSLVTTGFGMWLDVYDNEKLQK